MRKSSILSWRGAWLAASAAATVLAPAAWAAADGPTPIVRLLGAGAALEPDAHPAVISLGPPGAAWLPGDLARFESDDPVTCLTQAVYYEARSEPLSGQQAVAQVVINRTRLAAYPHSICGVVYQRASDVAGCQFSFVCDGSMERSIDLGAWRAAGAVARQAMGGFVFKPMIEATHYHAAWMTPWWSAHFTRIRQIGGHVFYR